MKGMTGFDLCRVLKADPAFARTPIVLVGSPDLADEAATRVGADASLPLPLDPEAFFATVRRFLQVMPREEARSAVGWSMTFWRDGVQHSGTIRDLSRGGFFVRTTVHQPVGARLEVSFDVPVDHGVRTVVAEAIVVRVRTGAGSGPRLPLLPALGGSRAHLEECLRIMALGEHARGAVATVAQTARARRRARTRRRRASSASPSTRRPRQPGRQRRRSGPAAEDASRNCRLAQRLADRLERRGLDVAGAARRRARAASARSWQSAICRS